jgi:hypothetical protein
VKVGRVCDYLSWLVVAAIGKAIEGDANDGQGKLLASATAGMAGSLRKRCQSVELNGRYRLSPVQELAP